MIRKGEDFAALAPGKVFVRLPRHLLAGDEGSAAERSRRPLARTPQARRPPARSPPMRRLCTPSSRGSLERADDNYTTKNTQQSTHGTYQAEHILEGDGLPLGVLVVGGRHGNILGGVAPPRRAKGSCLVGITFFAF